MMIKADRPGAPRGISAPEVPVTLALGLGIWAMGGASAWGEPPAEPPATWESPECAQAISRVQGHLILGLHSMESMRAEVRQARAAVAAPPAACHSADYYIAGANLLRQPEIGKALPVAGGGRLESVQQALDAGLAAAPKDAKLLAYIAHRVYEKPTDGLRLPADACQRVQDAPSNFGSYVCGVAALLTGQFADSIKYLRAIKEPARFPDVAELLLTAYTQAGRRIEGQRIANQMHKMNLQLDCDPFCPAYGSGYRPRKSTHAPK